MPGGLDDTPVFNSNSPEIVQTEGILLSTFPPAGMKAPGAHLNFAFDGEFEVFSHHINNSFKNKHSRTLYLGLLVNNPTDRAVKVRLLEAASYLSVPDAPFVKLPPLAPNQKGKIYAGPGDRVMDDFLRGKSQSSTVHWPGSITIPAHQSRLLYCLPVPDNEPTPHINGRSTQIRLKSNGKVYLANLALFAPRDEGGRERPPTLGEWQEILVQGDLCGPRENAATAPDVKGKLVYGRVSGVNRGAVWTARIPEGKNREDRFLPVAPDTSISFPISSVQAGTLGTGQVQSAPMMVRYPDTAYAAHGNYGVHYVIHLSLVNASLKDEQLSLYLQTPLKTDQARPYLEFYEKPVTKVFYRGTVRVAYRKGIFSGKSKDIHLVEDRGDRSQPLAQFDLPRGRREHLRVELFYPPDSTPPQVLTLKSESEPGAAKPEGVEHDQ
ncbi:MAG TPA: DUF3370 domain-containing protein [Chroococcales cyanobacterium]